jgi:type VI secretion system protein ImpH
VTTTFLGLYGPSSPLPSFYTEDLLHREAEDSLIRGFLDLFNHRMISLFYRAWEKYRYPIQFQPMGTDRISRLLVGLLGFDPDLAPQDLAVPPVRMLAYAGLIAPMVRSASGLRGILADHFPGVPVEIDQCTGEYLQIPEDQQCRLGQGSCSLGKDLVLGARIFDSASAFRIRLGPMDWDAYSGFLPGGGDRNRLRDLVGVFNSDRLDYEVEVRIRRQDLPEARLSSDRARLGWSTWLAGCPDRDPFVRFQEKG